MSNLCDIADCHPVTHSHFVNRGFDILDLLVEGRLKMVADSYLSVVVNSLHRSATHNPLHLNTP